MKAFFRIIGVCAAMIAAGSGAAEDAPLIAAAANLEFALTEIAAQYKSATGNSVRVTYGSSGNFFRQIQQGAPFEIFMSADEAFVTDLWREGLTRDDGDLYALGRLALVVPKGSPLRPDGTLDDLRAALRDGRLNRLAIANPEHAPYGQRAVEVLQHRGLWPQIESRLVFGENVSQAAQFAVSGNAEGGIIAYSLALSPELSATSDLALIPAEWHEPLRQRMVLLNEAGAQAEAFYTYLKTEDARAFFERNGFSVPTGGN